MLYSEIIVRVSGKKIIISERFPRSLTLSPPELNPSSQRCLPRIFARDFNF
jgi:hypothetical protein